MAGAIVKHSQGDSAEPLLLCVLLSVRGAPTKLSAERIACVGDQLKCCRLDAVDD